MHTWKISITFAACLLILSPMSFAQDCGIKGEHGPHTLIYDTNDDGRPDLIATCRGPARQESTPGGAYDDCPGCNDDRVPNIGRGRDSLPVLPHFHPPRRPSVPPLTPVERRTLEAARKAAAQDEDDWLMEEFWNPPSDSLPEMPPPWRNHGREYEMLNFDRLLDYRRFPNGGRLPGR